MLNINGELLEKMDANQYYLFSILLNYGKQSKPSNSVLMHKTGWALQKLQKVKKELESLNLLQIKGRKDDKKGGIGSNEYIIKTKLASKFNGTVLHDFHTIEIQTHENHTIEIQLDEIQLTENHADNKVLKLTIIENLKLLKEEERVKKDPLAFEFENLQQQLEKLEAEKLALKTELENQRKVAQKESFEVPPHKTDIEQAKWKSEPAWKVELKSSQNFNSLTLELQTTFLEFLDYREETLSEKQKKLSVGTVRQNFKKLLGYKSSWSEKEIIECLELAIEKSNTDFNPLFVKNKKERELKDLNNGKGNSKNGQNVDTTISYAERAMRERFGIDLFTNQHQEGSYNNDNQGVEQEF